MFKYFAGNPLLCFLLLCVSSFAYTQKHVDQSIFKKDSAYKQSVFKLIEDRYKADIELINGGNKKYFKEIYKERFDYIKTNFDQNAIITDPSAVSYINEFAQKILVANPDLQKLNPHILFYRAWWPNASSMGEGTVFVNIGIVYKLKNESQLAFVICHELAHLYLNHSNNAIDRYINTVYSDEFQKELKKISKQEYEKNKRLEEVAKKIAFKSTRHSREHEAEADSMALEFMKNTVFDIREAKAALAMLDTIDNDKFNIEPPLLKYFNNVSYPFQKNWLKKDDLFFGGIKETEIDKKLKDSLKTHPDIKQRVINVTPVADRYFKEGSILNANESEFKAWQKKFDYETVAFAYETDNISLALYYALQTIENYPGDPWLLSIIGNSLNKMYTAQKKHELNTITALPSPYREKKYDHFLQFIQNLSLSDIAAISYYFMEDNKAAGIANEDYVYALISSKDIFNKPAEKQEWINYYKTNFTKQTYKF
jgi:hypothetical protein